MTSYRGVILDIDGTLVNSNDAHANAWVRAFAEHGFAVPFQEVRRLIGMGGDKLLPTVVGIEEDSPKGKQISERRGDIFKKDYLPTVKALPGAEELLSRMHGAGLRLVVASSPKKDELKPLLALCGADKFIEDQTSSDDARHSKPDPDIVEKALTTLKLKPAQVVMLGDTPYDIEAAKRAGVAVIAFRSGGWSDAQLAGGIAVYQNPADLLHQYDISPIAAQPQKP
jgi:HAD superfamily hydrolase (TIGR01509 family)